MNNYSNRFARIEKCLNLNSDDDNSKITTIEDSLVDIKTFVDKLKNLLTHCETLTMNNGTVVIDADLGWIATKEDMIRCGTSTSKTDLSDFLDKIVGRELFENHNSFDQLSKPYQDALYKLAAVFVKAKSDVNNVSDDISTVTKSRIKKRFQNMFHRRMVLVGRMRKNMKKYVRNHLRERFPELRQKQQIRHKRCQNVESEI
ncbi:hypothetical protein BLOT_004982 [Blomia tropicalis]|nr:hypothetical protein BLOT_004982 [Blomia tropicalis]